ncbi:FxLYD domain-containing protein [Streptomyces sp. NPDC091268]|uniref:FxLYD domain-containing protein n=1 Tax=Streptomyces sp. NPDC091268 TaxID=3365979 RepID=UPI00382EF52B
MAAALLVAGCASEAKPAKEDPGPASGDVVITKQGFEDSAVFGPHSWMVRYTITNSGTDAADYFVTLKLADKAGKQIGKSSAVTTNVRPGASTEDRIVSLPRDMTTGTTANISASEVVKVERVPH